MIIISVIATQLTPGSASARKDGIASILGYDSSPDRLIRPDGDPSKSLGAPVNTRSRIVFRSTAGSPIGEIGESRVVQDSRWDFDGDRTIYFYSATYVLSGRCRYIEQSGRKAVYGPGDLFFCFPGVPHRFDPLPGDRFSELWIVFSGPVFDAWRRSGVLSPERMSLHLEPIHYWLGRFEGLFANVRNDEFGQMSLVASLQALLAEALSHQNSTVPSDPADAAWIAEATARVSAVAALDLFDLPAIAKGMDVSVGHFHRKFSALTGMSPGRYHSTVLMRHACNLMHNSWATNRRIAELLGFCNEFYFSRRFKQVIGVTPSEYREQAQQNRPG